MERPADFVAAARRFINVFRRPLQQVRNRRNIPQNRCLGPQGSPGRRQIYREVQFEYIHRQGPHLRDQGVRIAAHVEPGDDLGVALLDGRQHPVLGGNQELAVAPRSDHAGSGIAHAYGIRARRNLGQGVSDRY